MVLGLLAGDKHIGKHGVEILGDEETDGPILRAEKSKGMRGEAAQEGGQPCAGARREERLRFQRSRSTMRGPKEH